MSWTKIINLIELEVADAKITVSSLRQQIELNYVHGNTVKNWIIGIKY